MLCESGGMADAPDLGSGGETRRSSSLLTRTKNDVYKDAVAESQWSMATRMKYVPLRDRFGITFQEPEWWLLDMKKAGCFSHFLKGLGSLFGAEETLYLEGATVHPKVRAFLESHAAPEKSRVALGS